MGLTSRSQITVDLQRLSSRLQGCDSSGACSVPSALQGLSHVDCRPNRPTTFDLNLGMPYVFGILTLWPEY